MDEQATLEENLESNAPESMDDTIRKTWDEIQARGTPSEEEPPAADAPPQKARDDQGRFAKPEQQKEEAAPPAAQQQSASAPVPEWMSMGLRKEEAEAFARAPKEVQDAFARRLKETQEGVRQLNEQLGAKARAGEDFEKALAPFSQTLQTLGIPAHQAVQQLLAAEHGLRYGNEDQRATHALNVLSSYGINLQKLFAIASGQQQPAQQRAPMQQPQQQAPDLNKAVSEAVEARFLQQEIAQFKSQPGHERFEELAPVMGSLLQTGHAQSLEDAYGQALRAHPTYGREWLEKQLAEADAQRKADSQKKAKDARLAAAPNVPRRGTLSAAKPVGKMEDTIREEAERLGLF